MTLDWAGNKESFSAVKNKNVAKSRVTLPGVMAGPVSDRKETYVASVVNDVLCAYCTAPPPGLCIPLYSSRPVLESRLVQ